MQGLEKDQLFGLPCGSAVSRSRGQSQPERSQRGSSLGWLSTVQRKYMALHYCIIVHCHGADHHVEVPLS
jgi:hypothetical protein